MELDRSTTCGQGRLNRAAHSSEYLRRGAHRMRTFVRYQPSTQSRFLTDDEVNRTWPDVLLTRLSCE